MTSPKRDTWRVRSRREIEDTAVAARDAVLRAKTAALQKTKEVEVIDGPPLLEPLDIGDELDRVGYALVHVQAAENELSYLRSLLTKRRERLETERERQLAYGPETYRLFMEAEGSKRRKRIPPAALRSAIQAEVGFHAFTFREGLKFEPPREDGRRCLSVAELRNFGWIIQKGDTERWMYPSDWDLQSWRWELDPEEVEITAEAAGWLA